MTDTRRPISLLVSVALGLGAAWLLLAGGSPAVAAPAGSGSVKPAPAIPQCFARDDSAIGTPYSSTDSAAVRLAVAAAVPNDFVRLAGTCAGVAPAGGTTQTVLIDKVLTLEGGYTPTDWADTFPLTQPTTLDAQGLGRVITASADITVSALTIQHGYSGGGDGGGVYAGGNFTALGAVNILSNTTLLTPTVNGPIAPNSLPTGDGGGVWAGYTMRWPGTNVHFVVPDLVAYNSAANAGAIYAPDVNLSNVIVENNTAIGSGGAFVGTNFTISYLGMIGNRAGGSGGAIDAIGGTTTIDHSILNGNQSGGPGAAVNLYFGSLSISTSDVGNNTGSQAGGLYFYGAIVNVTGVRFFNNLATASGGGNNINGYGSVVNVSNSTFVDPNVNGSSGIVLIGAGGVPAAQRLELLTFLVKDLFHQEALSRGEETSANPLANSTVSTTTAIYASGVSVLVSDTIMAGYSTDLATDSLPTSTISGDYNLFDTTPVISGTGITTGTHSIVGNPLFVNAALGDLHLSPGSPAIGHGIDVGINVDLDGNPRPGAKGFDIGAYEFQFPKLFLPLVRR